MQVYTDLDENVALDELGTDVDDTIPAKSPIVSLSKLKALPITDVWPTEAYHFTPWLLDNGESLSELLGIDIELEAREYKVGRFSLDLFGREVSTGNPVIIENQFGPTDHGHLGQLLTYVGGTKPATIVWTAEVFREEHRAALDWLNEHTDPDVRFFGVKIGAVTIEGAAPGLIAPSLELVVKPNDWEKQVRAASAVSAGTSATNALYREFWTRFKAHTTGKGWSNAEPPAANYWYMPSGKSGVVWGVSFAQFGCRSELYFEDPDPTVNSNRWKQLQQQESAIRAVFGDGDLQFVDIPKNKICRIEARMNGPRIKETAQWPEVLDWMVDTQVRLRAAIDSVGGISAIDLDDAGA